MLADVKRVFPEDGSVGQDGTVTAWGKTGQWGGPPSSMADHHRKSTINQIRQNWLFYVLKHSHSKMPKHFIQCCQRVSVNTNQSSRILSRFAPISLSIVQCTVPSYPTHGARRDIVGTHFVF